jgi:hypothetical protein
VSYPRYLIPNEPLYRWVPIDEPIALVVARTTVSISAQVLRHLPILAGRFHISAPAAALEAMTDLITTAIATILKYVEAHPDHVHEIV